MNRQEIAFVVVLVVLIFLFWGEPDVMGALIEATRNWILK